MGVPKGTKQWMLFLVSLSSLSSRTESVVETLIQYFIGTGLLTRLGMFHWNVNGTLIFLLIAFLPLFVLPWWLFFFQCSGYFHPFIIIIQYVAQPSTLLYLGMEFSVTRCQYASFCHSSPSPSPMTYFLLPCSVRKLNTCHVRFSPVTAHGWLPSLTHRNWIPFSGLTLAGNCEKNWRNH